MNLIQFKTFNTDRATDIDELVAGLVFGKGLRTEFETLGIVAPEYVETQLKALRREIGNRVEEQKEAKRRSLKAQINSHKSREEKRKELEEELAALDAPTTTVP